MDEFFTFVGNHPFLVGTFVVLLVLFIRNEMQRGGATVGAQELVNLVNGDNALVLDVRDKAEYDAGHIVDAINIPFSNIDSRLDELKKHADKTIVITCKMGQHAGSVGTTLRKNGFENVAKLRGGIAEWRNQNLPVVKS